MNQTTFALATTLAADLTLVTEAKIDAEPNTIDADGYARIYVTASTIDAVRAAQKVVGCALANAGHRGSRHTVSGATIWRTRIGNFGGCRGWLAEYRCAFDVVAP